MAWSEPASSDVGLPDGEPRLELVADEVQGEQRDEQEPARDEGEVRRLVEVAASQLDELAPRDRRRLDGEAEEGEGALGDDEDGEGDEAERQHRREHVGEDLLDEDAPRLCAERS